MSYKLLRISKFYSAYLVNYYNDNPSIVDKSYKEQYAHLMHDTCEQLSFMSDYFKKAGVRSTSIITNAKYLQETWAEENGLTSFNTENIVFEQIKKISPSVLWIEDIALLHSDFINKVRSRVKSVKLIFTQFSVPFNDRLIKIFKELDFIFTCTPGYKNAYEKEGLKTFLIYFGFEPQINSIVNLNNRFEENDFIFTGSLYTGSGYHNLRIKYLETMASEQIPIKIYGNIEGQRKILYKKISYHLINFLQNNGLQNLLNKLPVIRSHLDYGRTPVKFYSKELIRAVRKPVFGIDMFRLVSRAKMTFNIHIDDSDDFAGNVRLFEATGAGTCLLTDHKENLKDLFDIDNEIVTYRSVNECISKSKWLLDNPAEMMKIAKAGQKRTLTDHNIAERVKLMNEIIINELKKVS